MLIMPNLFFAGRCEEALKFYESAVGAKIEFIFYSREAPLAQQMSDPDSVMHARLRIGDSQLCASDGCSDNNPTTRMSLFVSVKDTAEGQQVFDALAVDGTVSMPWGKTFWAEGFGMLVDQFGIGWMVNCELAKV